MTGTSKNKRVVLRNTLSAKKMAESEDMIDVCDDLGIESFFFEHVLDRTEEILDENSIVSSEHRISTPGGGGYSHTLPDEYVPTNEAVILKVLI